jgi:hypothetical protein
MPTGEQVVVDLDEFEIVIEEAGTVEVVEEVTLVVSEETGVEILEVSEPGPAGAVGPTGPQGPPGEAGGSSAFEETQIASIVPSEFVLAHVPIAASLRVFVNGLLQHSSSYALTGATVTLLPDLSLMLGDHLSFAYNY